MIAEFIGKIIKGKAEPPPPRREMVRPLPQNGPRVPDIVALLGGLEKKKLNDFVSHLVDFCYLPSKIKSTADLYSGDVFLVYGDVKAANAEAEKNNKVVTPKIFSHSGSRHFGAGAVTMNLSSKDIQLLSKERVSVVGLVEKGDRMFCEKLINVIMMMVAKCNNQYHIADLRYYLYLKDHPEWIPKVMRNGKGNIFAGSPIMFGSVPHVLVASWVWKEKEGVFGFKEELISLRVGLEDVAQFVLIKK